MSVKQRFGFLAVFIALTLAAQPLAAQPHVERVPDDAKLYIGWKGAKALGPSYDKSHLKAVLEAADAKQIFDRVIPQLVRLAGGQQPDAAAALEMVRPIARAVWDYPTALYFGGMTADGAPKLSVWIEAGDAADDLEQKLKEVLPVGAPIQLLRSDKNLIQLTTYQAAGEKPLKGSAPFAASMKQVDPQAALVVYFDVEALTTFAEQMMGPADPGTPAATWLAVKPALGLDGLKRIAYSTGFSAEDWGSALFVESPAPRTGLLNLFQGAAISEDSVALIPKTAGMAGAFSFDFAGLYTQIREGLGKYDPQMREQFDQAVEQVRQQNGLDIRKQLLEPFGPEWVYYTDAGVTGVGTMGMVVINKLRDPVEAAATLGKLEGLLNTLSGALMQGEDFRVQFRQTQHKGVTIHYLAIPFVAPSWAIHEGRLYLGLQPQVVAAAVTRPKGPSLADNDQFARLRQELRGKGPVTGFSFMDLQQIAPHNYQTSVLLTRIFTGFAEMAGIDAPPMLIPPLSDLRPHLGPVMVVSWHDEKGVYSRSRSPFPGSTILAADMSLLGVQQGALMAGILLPSLGRARELANRSVAGTRLSGIYRAMQIYAVDNNEKYPPDLGTLIKDGSVSPKNFISPRTGNKEPVTDDLDVLAQWANENSDFVIRLDIEGGPAANADEIVGYERIHPKLREGISILFGDGHVEFMMWDEARELLRKAGEEVPDILPGDAPSSPLDNLFGLAEPRVDDPEPVEPKAWYYDVVAKEYFTDSITQIAPFKRDNGNEAVRAHFFSCGDCTEQQRFLGYYEKYTEDIRAKLEADSTNFRLYEEAIASRLYSNDGVTWVSAEKPEGTAIIAEVQKKCPPKKLRYCPP